MKKIIFLITISLIAVLPSFGNPSKGVTITGSGDLKDEYSVQIVIYQLNVDVLKFKKVKNVKIVNHQFTIDLTEITEPTYINIAFPGSRIPTLHKYLVSPGKEIYLTIRGNDVAIGENLFKSIAIQHQVRMAEKNAPMAAFSLQDINPFLKSVDSLFNVMLRILDSNRNEFSEEEFEIVRADLYAYKGFEFRAFNDYLPKSKADRQSYLLKVRKYLDGTSVFIEPNLKANAFTTPYFVYQKYILDSCTLVDRPFELKACLKYLNTAFSGVQREKAVVYALAQNTSVSGHLSGLLNEIAQSAVIPEFKAEIEAYMAHVVDGAKAYDFTLTDTSGKKVRLSDFKGMPVVLDFWFTGCVNCRLLLPFMSAIEKKFEGKQVKFIAISVDKDFKTWIRGIKSGVYVSPGVINLMTNGNGRNDVVIDRYKIQGYPTLYLIDKQGRISNVQIDPREDNGQYLSDLIQANL